MSPHVLQQTCVRQRAATPGVHDAREASSHPRTRDIWRSVTPDPQTLTDAIKALAGEADLWTSGRIETARYGFALEESFCPSINLFLICQTGFLVILQDSQKQICDMSLLFHDHNNLLSYKALRITVYFCANAPLVQSGGPIP